MANRKLDFRLTRPQSKAFKLFRQPRTDINLAWGRGCGKSWFDRFVAWSWVAQADKVPRLELLEQLGVLGELDDEQRAAARGVKGIRVVFLLPTKKQFVDIHGRLLRQENADVWSHLRGSINGTTYQTDFRGGSFIAPFPASEHGSKRALGMRCDVVIADECDDIDLDVFDTVVRPWFSEPWSLKIRVTSGTPRRGRHGLLWQRHKAGLDPTQPRYHSLHATYRDNPEIVDSKEVDDARRNTPKSTFEREWECNFDAGEGLVYPFDEAFHVRIPDQSIRFTEHLIGVDHGWADAGVFLHIAIQGHGRDATAWVLSEIYQTEKPGSWWDEQARQFQGATFWCDPSRPDRIRDLQQRGLVTARGSDNDIHAGIARVADLLFKRETEDGAFARLYVHPSCVNLIREFGLYRRKKRPDGTFDEDPEDKNNHAMDALRYALVMRFGRLDNGKAVVSGA